MADLLLDKDIEALKNTVQSLIRERVLPAEVSQEKYVKDLSEEVIGSLQFEARKAGLQALGAKKEWGGAGLPLLSRAILLEEAAQHRLGLYHPAGDAFGGEFPCFLEKCSQEQIDEFVKPAINNGKGCFVALWEEQEDNHVESLTSKATKEGSHWILNGYKNYIQHKESSTFGVILVNCLLENGVQKPTLFLLDSDEQLNWKETMLIDVQKTYSLTLKNFQVHDQQRIGQVGEGIKLIKQWLAESQVILAAKCIGVSVKAVDYGKQYANLRITRGKTLAEFPTIRSMLAKALINLQAARLMVRDAALKIDNQEDDAELCAQMAKHFATDTAAKIIDDVLQIHGGSGFAGDLPIERWYKEIRIARVNLQKAETIIENVAKSFL
jgi:acyl-CoA dehydrogenase